LKLVLGTEKGKQLFDIISMITADVYENISVISHELYFKIDPCLLMLTFCHNENNNSYDFGFDSWFGSNEKENKNGHSLNRAYNIDEVNHLNKMDSKL